MRRIRRASERACRGYLQESQQALYVSAMIVSTSLEVTMGSAKQYKSTALTIVVMALVVIFGVSFVLDPDSSTSDRTWGIVMLVAASAAGVGLWCLATKRLTVAANQVLIVVGLVAAGALALQAMANDFSFFVWVYGPLLVLVLLALWFGVVKRGLQTELAG